MMAISRFPVSRTLPLAVCLLLAAVGTAQAQTSTAVPDSGETNTLRGSFSVLTPQRAAARAPAERALHTQQLARLNDPLQRPAVLQEYRERVRSFNPDLSEFLGLEPDLEQKLVQLLAEQKLADEIRSAEQRLAMLERRRDDYDADGSASVAVFDRDRGALRVLLGPAVFGRYLDYLDLTVGLARVHSLDTKLGEQRLTRDQKAKLAQLYTEQHRASRGSFFGSSTGVLPVEQFEALRNSGNNGLQTFNLLLNVRLNEDILERETMQQRELLQSTAKFLNNSQLAMLEKVEAANLAARRQNLRSLRQQAGLDPDQPLDQVYQRPNQPRVLKAAPMQWTLQVVVNQRLQDMTFTSRSGETVSFETPAGLLVDAVATAYDNERMQVSLTMYERGEAKRHRIGDLDASGPLRAATNTDPLSIPVDPLAKLKISGISGSSTVLAGSRGYALTFSVLGKLQ
jgi:hypothetical protein